MVIEHSFITTLEGPDALGQASRFLHVRGFTAAAQTSFPVNTGWNVIDMSRQTVPLRRAKGVDELPMRVRLEWDRGRVNVAAAISPKTEKQEKGKSGALMTSTLFTLCQSMELLLWNQDEAQAAARWNEIERQAQERRARRAANTRKQWIAFGLFVGGAVILGVILYFLLAE